MRLYFLLHLKGFLFVFLVSVWGKTAFAVTICPGIESSGSSHPPFSDEEKLLLCGNAKLDETKFKAWVHVPPSQAAYHLRGFLQARGYLNPEIEIREDKLVFNPGELVRVKAVRTQGAPSGLDISKRRGIQDGILTPSLLDELKNWSLSELQQNGYPCPQVQVLANSQNGEILIQMEPGKKDVFGKVLSQQSNDLDSQIWKRYQAYSSEQEFDLRLLHVTEERIISEGLADQVEFVTNCFQADTPLIQTVALGPPRILNASFMANTEVIAQVQTSYRQHRIGKYSSFWDVSAVASRRLLEFSTSYHWYFKNAESAAAIRPFVVIRYQDEEPFRLNSIQSQLFYLNRWETSQGHSIRAGLGPEYQYFQIRSGPLDEQNISSTSLQSELEIQSYSHEIYRQNIYEGYRLRIGAGTQSNELASEFTAQNLKIESERLSNLSGDFPPGLMGAWRLIGSTTFSPHPEKLPPTYRHYLGGIDTLRGFGRYQLPDSDAGALTRLSSSFELRSAYWSPTFWPVVFLDFGWLGQEALSLESHIYKSPGAGFHWKSPVGPIRVSLAHGEAEADLYNSERKYRQWQFFASFGERF